MQVPEPAPWVTVPEVVLPSPQLIEHVWVSAVPASVKLALAVARLPSAVGELVVTVPTTGSALATV